MLIFQICPQNFLIASIFFRKLFDHSIYSVPLRLKWVMLNYHFEYKYIYYHLRFGHEVLWCCKTCIYLYTVICLPIKRCKIFEKRYHYTLINYLHLDIVDFYRVWCNFSAFYAAVIWIDILVIPLKNWYRCKKIQYEILLVRFMRVYLSIHHGSSKKSPILIKRWLLKINVKWLHDIVFVTYILT